MHSEVIRARKVHWNAGKFLRDNDFDIEIWEAIDIMDLEM